MHVWLEKICVHPNTHINAQTCCERKNKVVQNWTPGGASVAWKKSINETEFTEAPSVRMSFAARKVAIDLALGRMCVPDHTKIPRHDAHPEK